MDRQGLRGQRVAVGGAERLGEPGCLDVPAFVLRGPGRLDRLGRRGVREQEMRGGREGQESAPDHEVCLVPGS